jgi:hypothetical protein
MGKYEIHLVPKKDDEGGGSWLSAAIILIAIVMAMKACSN